MTARPILICLALLGALSTGMAEGEGTNKTVITADRLSYDYKTCTALLEGHVVATDPRLKIESDELRATFSSTNQLKSATAIGNVRLRSEDKTATCNRAVYLTENQQVTLTGNARLVRGRDTVTGDRIIFYLDEDRVVVEGGTQLVVFPDSKGGENPLAFPDKKSGQSPSKQPKR